MGSHAYARIERERRFLLDGLPPPVSAGSTHELCTDVYFQGMRMRLRSLVPSDGRPAEYKLGQKHQPSGLAPSEREMTTLYLTREEHAFLFERLAGGIEPLVKRRYRVFYGALRYTIDAFEGRCAGLVLADLELADAEALRLAPPPPRSVREITDDPRYECGTLARDGLPLGS